MPMSSVVVPYHLLAIPLRISYSSNRWVVGLGTRLVVVGVCFALPCLLAGLASPCLAAWPCLALHFFVFCCGDSAGGFIIGVVVDSGGI